MIRTVLPTSRSPASNVLWFGVVFEDEQSCAQSSDIEISGKLCVVKMHSREMKSTSMFFVSTDITFDNLDHEPDKSEFAAPLTETTESTPMLHLRQSITSSSIPLSIFDQRKSDITMGLVDSQQTSAKQRLLEDDLMIYEFHARKSPITGGSQSTFGASKTRFKGGVGFVDFWLLAGGKRSLMNLGDEDSYGVIPK
nr:hypothetical protein HmN_000831300 [Hymenolepis microstoma]